MVYFVIFISLDEKVWCAYADLYPPRARTLVICTYIDDELELYGNYLIDSLVLLYYYFIVAGKSY